MKTIELEYTPGAWGKQLQPVVEEVLGVSFGSDFGLVHKNIRLDFSGKYPKGTWSALDRERLWQGVTITLSFFNVNHAMVKRALLVKPDGKIDDEKLRAKWEELLALKSADDAERQQQREKFESDEKRLKALQQELKDMGVDNLPPGVILEYRGDGIRMHIDSLPLTPDTIKKIIDILG
jgi:hypothetical protein